MDITTKLPYFDYFLSALFAYGAEPEIEGLENRVRHQVKKGVSISKLKALKLLFFVVAVDNQDWVLLEKVFDNFYALPYGPVESDVYDHLSDLPNYRLNGNDLVLKENADFAYSNCEDCYKKRIYDSINILGHQFPMLFSMSAIELVELSHRSDCWQIAITQANSNGYSSGKMSHNIIKQSRVYFY